MTFKMISLLLALCSVSAAASIAKEKLSCTSKELVRKDCPLKQGSFRLRLLDASVAWGDGIWHVVEKTPLNGDGTFWEKVHFSVLAGRPILQMWIWDKGAGEAVVQSLRWFTMDLSHRRASVLAEEVVRKRRLNVVEPAEVGKSSRKAVAGPKFIYDQMEAHGLQAGKDGVLHFQLGRNRRVLEKISETLAEAPAEHESGAEHAGSEDKPVDHNDKADKAAHKKGH
jgi:hypothetical protein